MQKITILQNLQKTGLIAVVRAASPAEAVEVSEALIKGGVKGIELTFTTPNVCQAILELSQKYGKNNDIVIGAGTVLDANNATNAINAGSKFVVSPCFDIETAKICNLYAIPYLPGCITPTEVHQALQYGVDIIKLFPGSLASPSYIKALKAPFPQVNIMPTGGVNRDNMKEWFDNGAIAVGVGGDLLAPLKDKDFAKITELAQSYSDTFKKIKG
jgi:2-dehydro-3-deoxyphosphogluconate aldolase/(4S)-4-hydroxy-2-oxoglutarate aldolase